MENKIYQVFFCRYYATTLPTKGEKIDEIKGINCGNGHGFLV